MVQAVGPGVHDLKPGDGVAVEPNNSCEDCPECDRGMLNFCSNRLPMAWGAWSDVVVANRHHITPLPSGADMRTASLTEPLACVVRGFDRVTVNPGDTVFVAGAGPIGLLSLQVAKHQGAGQTIVSEPGEIRRKLAATLGADLVLDPRVDDVVDATRSLTQGYGADLTIEAAGAGPAFQSCLDAVRDSGTVLVISVGNPSERFELRLYDFFARERTIVGSNTRVRTFERALELLPEIDVEPIITHTFDLDDAVEAVMTAKSGAGAKVIFDFRS